MNTIINHKESYVIETSKHDDAYHYKLYFQLTPFTMKYKNNIIEKHLIYDSKDQNEPAFDTPDKAVFHAHKTIRHHINFKVSKKEAFVFEPKE